ncbi:MAG: glycosyltransferase [Burkholderiales bacterium]
MTDPIVSIALPVRNSAATLRETLRSIRWQTLSEWELLVMDDGSTDASTTIVREFDDPRIRLHSDGRHAGLASRLNQAIDLARGRYLARMDADDIAYPERLATQVAYLDRHPDVDLVASRALAFRNDGEVIGLLPFRGRHEELCARPWSSIPMPHPTWVGRIEWFRRYRYGVPDAPRAEDQELLMRAAGQSRYAACPEILLGYRQGAYSVTRTVKGRFGRVGAYARHANAAGQRFEVLRALATACVKTVFDVAAGLPGCESLYFRRMGESPSSEQAQTWAALWKRLHA